MKLNKVKVRHKLVNMKPKIKIKHSNKNASE